MQNTALNRSTFLAFFHKKILNIQAAQTFFQRSCYLVEIGKIYLNNNLTNRNEYEKINVCTGKLRKECNLLEMSVG